MANSKIPKEISETYESLHYEVTQLFVGWKFYNQLYRNGKEKIDVLNFSASNFFLYLHGILLEYLFLSVRRITDPKQTRKDDNLSLEQLIDKIDPVKYFKLKHELETFLNNEKHKFEPFRKFGNKLVAHNDLKELQQNYPSRLPNNISIKSFEDTLKVLSSFLNKIAVFFDELPVTYSDVQIQDDAEDLINCLNFSKKAYEKKLNELKN